MPGAFMYVWDDAVGEWVKMQVTAAGLVEVSVGNFPATYPLSAAQIASLKIITDYPDPIISQATATNLKHVPHAQVTGDGVYKPLQLDASDYLMVAIKALPSLNDITDVNVPVLVDGDFLVWDTATSKWIKLAHAALPISASVHGNTYMARAHRVASQLNILTGSRQRIELTTVTAPSYNPGSHFQTGVWYDNVQADADSDATHIQDDDAAFPDAINLALVSWTSDGISANAGTGYINAVDSDTLTIAKNSGADFAASYYYTINHADYKVPVAGYYLVVGNLAYIQVVADKRYYVYIGLNGASASQVNYHSASTDALFGTVADIMHFEADDLITLLARQESGVDTVDIYASADGLTTFLSVALVQAD